MKNPFENISKKNINKLLDLLYADTYIIKKNECLPKTIIDNKSIIIIVNGYIHVIRNTIDGNDIIVDELEENDVYGSSLSYIKSNEYEMIAKEDSKVIVIDEDILINFDDTSKLYYFQFIKNLFKILTEIMREKNERIRIITKKTIRDKLLDYFSILRKKNNSVNIYIPYSYGALADYLGVNRSALMREIKNLKEEGFIESKGNRIKLLY